MSRTRRALLSLVVTGILSGALASSATAAVWFVAGNPLGKGAKESFSSLTAVTTNPTFTSTNLVVECSTMEGTANFIFQQFEGGGGYKFKTCVIPTELNNCEVENTEFKTKALNWALLGPTQLEMLPASGQEFAEFKINNKGGNACKLAGGTGKYVFEGAIIGSLVQAGVEKKEHLINFLAANPSHMEVKSPKAGAKETVKFGAEFQLLAETNKWSTHC